MEKKTASKTMRIDLIPQMNSGMVPEHSDNANVPPHVVGHIAPEDRWSGQSSYEDLFHSVYDAAFLVDRGGAIVDVNARAIEFFGYERDDLLSLSLLDIVSGADTNLMSSVWDNLANQRFSLIQAYCLRQDDSYFPAEIAVSRLKDGDEWVLCWFVRDISIRRHAEEMLLTEHNAIRNAAEGIAVVGVNSCLEFVNPAVSKLWAYGSPEQLIGADAGSLFEDSGYMTGLIEDVMAVQNRWVNNVNARRSDGVIFPVRCSVACNRNSEGVVVGVVVALSDLTDQLRADKAQQESEQQRVMLESLGAACHHLGQPATVLLANLGLLERESGDMGADAVDLVEECVRAGELLADVMHRLNEFNEYKTTRYLDVKVSGQGGGSILDL